VYAGLVFKGLVVGKEPWSPEIEGGRGLDQFFVWCAKQNKERVLGGDQGCRKSELYLYRGLDLSYLSKIQHVRVEGSQKRAR